VVQRATNIVTTQTPTLAKPPFSACIYLPLENFTRSIII